MFTIDNTELDALILVGQDPAGAERCLSALVAVSMDVPLRTWVLEANSDPEQAAALRHRCVWTRGVEGAGTVSQRINRAFSQGRAPYILILDGSVPLAADTLRALIQRLRETPDAAAIGLGALEGFAQAVRPGSLGPALLVRREALETVGGFDERGYSGVQAEAEAWCRRAEQAGQEVLLSSRPREVVRNVPRLTLARPVVSPILERRMFRSRYGAGAPAIASAESLRGALVARANDLLR